MPIYSPQDARNNHVSSIPEFITDAFNELLAEKWNKGSDIIIYQKEVMNRIFSNFEKYNEHNIATLSRQEIYDNKWLDIEDLYRKNGWYVEFDKPGYNERYEPHWIFRPKL